MRPSFLPLLLSPDTIPPFWIKFQHFQRISLSRLTEEKITLNEDMQELLDLKFQRLLEHLSEKPLISVTFFCPDKRKQGGSYVSISGTVKKLDLLQRILTPAQSRRGRGGYCTQCQPAPFGYGQLCRAART